MENKEMCFTDVVDNYVNTLKAQIDSAPVIINTLLSRGFANSKKLADFISEYGIDEESEKRNTKSIPEEKMNVFFKLSKNMRNAFAALELFQKNMVVSLMCIYDAFLGDLIRLIYMHKPELLNACEKSFTFSEIAKYESIEKIKEKIIEKEVECVLRNSHAEQFSWISKKLGNIPLTNKLPSFKDFIEISERRNLFVHTGGIVSDQYIEMCKKYGCTMENNVGDNLDAPYEYIKHSFEILLEIGVKLSQVVWRVVGGDTGMREADKHLNWITYDLLNEGKLDVAQILLDFAVEPYVKHKDQMVEYMHKINRALCLYMRGKKEDCILMLDKIDLSAVDVQFKLADAVLREKYDSAIHFMEPFAQSSEYGSEVYDEWPLFREFIKDQRFKDEYKRIYGKEFECVDCRPVKWEETVQSALQIIKEVEERKSKMRQEPLVNEDREQE